MDDETIIEALTKALEREWREHIMAGTTEVRLGHCTYPVDCPELWEALEAEVTVDFPDDGDHAVVCVLADEGGSGAGYESDVATFDCAAAARAALAEARQIDEGREDDEDEEE